MKYFLVNLKFDVALHRATKNHKLLKSRRGKKL